MIYHERVLDSTHIFMTAVRNGYQDQAVQDVALIRTPGEQVDGMGILRKFFPVHHRHLREVHRRLHFNAHDLIPDEFGDPPDGPTVDRLLQEMDYQRSQLSTYLFIVRHHAGLLPDT